MMARTVATVLAQTFDDLEVIVSDDGSTDDTAVVVDAIEDPRVHYVRQDNAGGCAARNNGARAARGRWLAFLDDDDEVEPTWLATLRTELMRPGSAVACCGSAHVLDDGSFVRVNRPRQLGPPYSDFTGKFDTGTYAVTRELFDVTGGFVDGLPSSAHNELAFRLTATCAERGWSVHAVPDPLVLIRHRPSSAKPRNHPSALYTGTRYVLDHHGDKLGRTPRLLANWLSVAAVSAARMGDYGEARRLLARAVRVSPKPRFAARFAVALLPPLARRVWKVEEFRTAERSAAGAHTANP